MGKKKSIAIYARDVVFENNEESFIKMCYMMNNKITDAICNEIENLNCTVQYIDIDMAISRCSIIDLHCSSYQQRFQK